MANTRYKGANSSERLTISTLSDSDMFQTRHLPGTVNDADKGVSKSLLQAVPVAICATAAATAAKVGTLAAESFPDFVLANGRTVHVYFSAANTASVPTLNLAGTGAIPITYPNGDYVGAWSAGTSMELMYISITDGNTTIERWVLCSELPVDAVTADNMHSVTSGAVANLMGISENDEGLIPITDLVTKYLGATSVNISRKNNLVYLAISGIYSGVQTTTTQQIISGLPEKYRPSFEQSGACMSYASGGNYIYISRLRVGTDGTVYLAECGFPRNSTMRISILYMI